ncbi:MAG TPA: hypothetical protein VMY41_11050, partial [Thermohalobaculum sp.]|nr:hypothetical protein [Thermohalobaculum sp.]
MGGDSDNKNLILAAVLSMAVVFAWQMFFVTPPLPVDPAAVEGQAGAVPGATVEGGAAASATETVQTRGE